MKLNVPQTYTAQTHEGGPAFPHTKPLEELRRAVSTCLLWENTFYEKGSDLGERISALCDQVNLFEIGALAIEARGSMKLRHVPLFLVGEMARINSAKKLEMGIVSSTLADVIRRPDEITEFLAIYWRNGKRPLPKQVKLGLALAFQKFNRQALSKWNRDGKIKLRDALFLVHPEPRSAEQVADWKALVDGTLEPADTWEVALSGGANKKETWERLLLERKLGYQALLMNLRNMSAVGVDSTLIEAALRDGAPKSMMLPFRFVTAAKHAPQYAQALSDAMLLAIDGSLPGPTALLIDVSGSMDEMISAKSVVKRWQAAGALAVLVREMNARTSLHFQPQYTRVFTFSNRLIEVGNLRGIGLIDAIGNSQLHGGTQLAAALRGLQQVVPVLHRLVVVTDEQSHDGIIPSWATHSYLLNVASYKPALDQRGGWKRIHGWSEQVVRWMLAEEAVVEAERV